MLTVTLRGVRATYTTTDGWRSTDGLTERHLRNVATPDAPDEGDALTLADAAWAGDCEIVSDDDAPPAPAVLPVASEPDAS